MPEENMNQELRFKKSDEIRNYLIGEINRNELMSKKQKKGCRSLNYIDHSLIVIYTITGCVLFSAFASLVGFLTGITSFAIESNIFVITAGIKKCQLINKKKKRHMILLLAKSKLDSIEFLISIALIDLNISHDEFVLTNNVLKKCDDRKGEIKNSKK